MSPGHYRCALLSPRVTLQGPGNCTSPGSGRRISRRYFRWSRFYPNNRERLTGATMVVEFEDHLALHELGVERTATWTTSSTTDSMLRYWRRVMTHEETLRYLAPDRFRVQQRCAEHEARDARRVSARLPGVSAARRSSMAMIGIQC